MSRLTIILLIESLRNREKKKQTFDALPFFRLRPFPLINCPMSCYLIGRFIFSELHNGVLEKKMYVE